MQTLSHKLLSVGGFFRETQENNLLLKEQVKSLLGQKERVDKLTSHVAQLQLANEVSVSSKVPSKDNLPSRDDLASFFFRRNWSCV